jgi:hypothetical protein
MLMKRALKEGKDWDAYVQYCSIPNDPDHLEEILYISNQLDARERNVIKTYQAAENKYGER